MSTNGDEIEVTYNPSSILTIFTNNISNEITRKVFKVQGIYSPGNGISYKGLYYDSIKDETGDACMTTIVPGLLRAQLMPNQVIECSAYLSKRIQLNGGKIDLQLNIIELVSQSVSTYTEDQLKAFQVLERKAEVGYRDVDGFIKSKIINSEPLTVCIIIGKAGIIDSDIKHQLQEAICFYKFNFIRINLTSEKQITEAMLQFQKDCDILAISRGGGEK